MRRLIIRTCVLVLAVSCGVALAATGNTSSRKAWVRLEHCSLLDHSALFYARMRSVPGSVRMKLRFTLLERAGGRAFEKVGAPELAHWRKSSPGVSAFGYHQEVRGLHEGSTYRASVRYRWYDQAGQVVKRMRRRSRPCKQFTTLPNLRVQLVGAQRTAKAAAIWRYDVRLRNAGRLAAVGVPVQLAVDGAVIDTLTVDRLEPGESRLVRFRGPGCQQGYTAVADPDGTIPETNELDNQASAGC